MGQEDHMTLRAWQVFVLDWAWGQRFCLVPATVPLTWPATTLKDILWLSATYRPQPWALSRAASWIRRILSSRGSEHRNLWIPGRG